MSHVLCSQAPLPCVLRSHLRPLTSGTMWDCTLRPCPLNLQAAHGPPEPGAPHPSPLEPSPHRPASAQVCPLGHQAQACPHSALEGRALDAPGPPCPDPGPRGLLLTASACQQAWCSRPPLADRWGEGGLFAFSLHLALL